MRSNVVHWNVKFLCQNIRDVKYNDFIDDSVKLTRVFEDKRFILFFYTDVQKLVEDTAY